MRKRAPQHLFEDNLLHDDFAEWLDSHEGRLSQEVSDNVSELLERTDLDARNREIILDDGRVFDVEGLLGGADG